MHCEPHDGARPKVFIAEAAIGRRSDMAQRFAPPMKDDLRRLQELLVVDHVGHASRSPLRVDFDGHGRRTVTAVT